MSYNSMAMKLALTIVMLAALLPSAGLAGAVPQPSIEDLTAMRATDPVALLQILDQELAEIEPEADPRHVAHQFRLRSETLRDRGEYVRSREDASEFQQLARSLDDPVLISRALMLHGTIDAEQNNIADALGRFHEARQVLEATQQTNELAMVNNAIGVAHNFAFDFVRARHYYEEALRLARLADNEALENSVLGNLALAISHLEGPEAGLPLHREALTLADQRGDRHGVALQNALICERLMEVGRLVEARLTCLNALDQVAALQLSRPLAGVRMTLGAISREEGKLREAVGFFETAMEDAAGVVPSVVLELHRQLSEVYEALGESGPALHHLQALVSLRQESRERERQSVVEELEVKYKVEQRERQFEVMTLDAQLQDSQLQQRTQLLLITSVGLAFACIGAMVAWRGYRIKSGLERQLDMRNQELEQAVEQIGKLARTDTLTGLWNRRAFDELVADEMARARRDQQPLTIVLADIDGFKTLNDRFGHQAGDEVLKELAGQLQTALRTTDSVFRWGGEEFLCLLPNNDLVAAQKTVERVRQQISEHPVKIEGQPLPMTMTFGIAPLSDDVDAAIRDADAAMYEGKRRGRDQVVVADPESSSRCPEPYETHAE